MTMDALLRPCTSSGAPFCASITRSKAMPLSRSAATAFSSAAAERGITQRPKARKEARSSGRAAFGRQRTDQLRLPPVVVPDDDALVAQIEQRLGALDRGVEVADAVAQIDILGRRSRALADEERPPREALRPSRRRTSQAASPRRRRRRTANPPGSPAHARRPPTSTDDAAEVQSSVFCKGPENNPAPRTRRPLPPA